MKIIRVNYKLSYRRYDSKRNFAASIFQTLEEAKQSVIDDRERVRANFKNDKHPMTLENYNYWMSIKYIIEEVREYSHVVEELI